MRIQTGMEGSISRKIQQCSNASVKTIASTAQLKKILFLVFVVVFRLFLCKPYLPDHSRNYALKLLLNISLQK